MIHKVGPLLILDDGPRLGRTGDATRERGVREFGSAPDEASIQTTPPPEAFVPVPLTRSPEKKAAQASYYNL